MSESRVKENKFILYTDIVGHTKMFGRLGAAFRPMRERHDELFMQAVNAHSTAAVVQGAGDGFYAATDDVQQAIETALAFRKALADEDWGRFLPPERRTPDNAVKARLGIHSGLVTVLYVDGVAKNFDGAPRGVAEKVMGMAQGNQILVTRQVRDQAQVNLARRDELEMKKFGEYLLRGINDTVEVWGLGEVDRGVGPKPVQPPEHRVIVFATIHDFSAVGEKLGPVFDGLKDKWDAAFTKAVRDHSKDAFVKRLPDGSLGAFKNAMDATRAALHFRRLFKEAMKNVVLPIEPKIALDSGLVTFDYENNAAVDVRDQPVNISAKVCKTGLAAPWQLILTRPVREDAYQNLPDRDEFRWVCLGRKQVPGEAEPVELWDFQDVQTKGEHRTLVWVDARNVKDALRLLPPIYQAFTARLSELLREVISRRSEEPWVLPTENGIALGFKDPVEAVQAAIDLRETALKEQWERFLTGFKRGHRDDNLLRICLASGQVKLTYEDGLVKDFKGPAVEAVRPLADAAANSQIFVARELKETVAAAFPESDVRWRKVEAAANAGAAGGPPAGIDAFELRRGAKKGNTPMIAVVSAAAVVVLAGALLVPRLLGGGGGGQAGSWKPGDPPPQAVTAVVSLEQSGIDPLTEVGRKARSVVQAYSAERKGLTLEALSEEVKGVTDRLTALHEQRARLNRVAFPEYVATLAGVNDTGGLERWLEGTADFMEPRDDKGAPLPNPAEVRLPSATALASMRAEIALAADSPRRREVEAEFNAFAAAVEAARARPWIRRDIAAVEAEADRLTAEYEQKVSKGIVEIGKDTPTARLTTVLSAGEPAGPEWGEVNTAWRGVAEAIRKRRDAEPAAKLLAEAERARADLSKLPDKFRGSLAAEGSAWERAVATLTSAERRRLVKRAADAAGKEAFTTEAEGASKEFDAFFANAKKLVEVGTTLTGGLDRAYGLSETPPKSSQTVAQLWAAVLANELSKNETVKAGLEPVARRIAELEALAKATTVADVRAISGRARPSTPEVYWAAWQRLADPALAGQTGYASAVDVVMGEVKGLTPADLPDEQRLAFLRAEVTREAPARWVAAFDKLRDEASISAAMRLRGALGVGDAIPTGLTASARFNYRLWTLRRTVEGTDEAAVRAALDAFADDPLWGQLPVDGPEARVRQALLAARAGGAGGGAAPVGAIDLATAGPGARGWKFIGTEDGGDVAVYELVPTGNGLVNGQTPPRLKFVRLAGTGLPGGAVSYLCTTEVSVGLAIEVLNVSNGWNTFASAYNTTKDDDFRGPIYWWRSATKQVRLGNAQNKRIWTMYLPSLDNKPYYPPGGEPPAPNLDSPMQYLTPTAALTLARYVNCRPPSPAEFKAAVESDPGAQDVAKANLRDQTFGRLQSFRADPGNRPNNVPDPDAQAFGNVRTNDTTYPHNDGVLWFADVDKPAVAGGGRRFVHLIGNVAELVFDRPVAIDGLAIDGIGSIIAGAETSKEFGVVGGSALGKVQPIEALKAPVPVLGLTQPLSMANKTGWSDVGLRLAFTARPAAAPTVAVESFVVRVRRAIDGVAYTGGNAG
jgi:hypothetical protein